MLARDGSGRLNEPGVRTGRSAVFPPDGRRNGPGRYFITRQSLHTLTSEAVRSALVNCFNQTSACSLTSTNKSTVAAKVPFLVPGSIVWVTASQSAPNPATGVRTITVGVTYPFTFVLPAWTGLFTSGISETTSLQY